MRVSGSETGQRADSAGSAAPPEPSARGGLAATSAHRYRVLELLDAAMHTAGLPEGSSLRAAPGVLAQLRERWVPRYRVSETDWTQIMRSIDDYRGPKIRKDAQNLRRFFEAVMWVADTGARWSDLPKSYGQWRRIYVRFARWSLMNYWKDIVPCLGDRDQRSALLLLIGNYHATQRVQQLYGVLSTGNEATATASDKAWP